MPEKGPVPPTVEKREHAKASVQEYLQRARDAHAEPRTEGVMGKDLRSFSTGKYQPRKCF